MSRLDQELEEGGRAAAGAFPVRLCTHCGRVEQVAKRGMLDN